MELECYKEHTKKLRHHVEQLTKEDIMLAFSGGVDSTLLLYLSCEAAKKSGKKVYAMTAKTTLHPMKEAKEAKENALKQTKEVKEKAKQEKDYSLVQMLYQLVTDHVLSKSEAIRRSGMSSYKFMKIVRQMNPGV